MSFLPPPPPPFFVLVYSLKVGEDLTVVSGLRMVGVGLQCPALFLYFFSVRGLFVCSKRVLLACLRVFPIPPYSYLVPGSVSPRLFLSILTKCRGLQYRRRRRERGVCRMRGQAKGDATSLSRTEWREGRPSAGSVGSVKRGAILRPAFVRTRSWETGRRNHAATMHTRQGHYFCACFEIRICHAGMTSQAPRCHV